MTQYTIIEADVGQVRKREHDEVQKRKQNESPGRTAAAGDESNDARTARGTVVGNEAIDKIQFLQATPLFEEMLIRSNIKLIKYWFSVSDDERERWFQARLEDPSKHWKLSPMDLESRKRWVKYSRAKDVMFARTDTKLSPWRIVEADVKRHARLNTISHLLSSIPYVYEPKPPLELPERQDDTGYVRPPRETMRYVPEVY